MQTKIFLPVCLSTLFMMTFSSCKKDKEQSKTDLITTGQWQMSAYTITPPYDVDGDGIPDSDGYATFDLCEKDNFFVFKKDGVLEENEGPPKCHPSDPQIDMGTWSFSNNETEVTINGDVCTIQELTSSNLRVKVPVATSIAEITFVR